MKASNLGVVFGRTLMRPERESVATIVDIKYQNIVVADMIEEMDKVGCGMKHLNSVTTPLPKPEP